MTEQIPGLMGFVVRAVKTNPAISSKELYDRSRQRYPAVEKMTVRQFHARYPLQAKRQLNRPVVRRFPTSKGWASSVPSAVESRRCPEP